MPARCLSSSVAIIRNFWFTSGLRTLVGQFHALPVCAWQSLSEHGRICLICPDFLSLSAEENCIQTIICWDWAPNAVSFSCCNRFRKESRQACSSGSASAVACLGSFMMHSHSVTQFRTQGMQGTEGKQGKLCRQTRQTSSHMPYNALQCLTMPYNALQCLTMPYNALQCLTQKNMSTLRSWHQVLLLLLFARLRFNMIQLPSES